MAVDAASISVRNIRLSVQKFVKAWADSESLAFGFIEVDFDPDALNGGTPVSEWGALTWLSDLAGAKGSTMFQIDLLTDSNADPISDTVRRLTDSLQKAFRSVRQIDVYDYSAVTSVADTEVLVPNNPLIVQNGGKHFGMRSAILGPVRERGLWRVSATFRVSLLSDLARGQYYVIP